jgi:hypothetical protein
MAGFEIVVRPVVFPDIRPAPAQPVPPADDPTKGFATIHGNGGHSFSTSSSYSASASSSQRTEIKRREDEARVYQKKKDGKINKKNFVDIRAPNKVWMKGPPSQKTDNRPSFAFGQGPMEGGPLDRPPAIGPEKEIYYYNRIKGKDNIEIRRKDIVTSSDGQESGGTPA